MKNTRRNGGRILAIGLTVMGWTLSSAWAQDGASTQPAEGEAKLDCKRTEVFKGPDEIEEAKKDWQAELKQPFPWWKWGADLRLREVYIGNAITFDKSASNHEIHWQRQRLRWWNTFTPAEGFEFNMRIAWEGKHFDRPTANENWQPTSTVFDNLNFKLTDFLGSPVTIQAGRQDLMLGDRWLVMDGTPLDGSSTIYFDAVRFLTDFEEIDTKLDLIYIEMDAEQNNWINPIRNRDKLVTEQDETGVIAWITNKSLPKTQLDGYFIYKKGTPSTPVGNDGEIYTFGTIIEHAFTEKIKLQSDVAYQFGHERDNRISALGTLNRFTYSLKDEWDSWFRMDYEYLSGDDPDTDTVEEFDLLWGRWPRFSEMYIYSAIGETGRIGDMANLHRVSWGFTTHPSKRIETCFDYHLLFADQNTLRDLSGFSNGGCFRGQLLTALMKYKINANLSGHLLAEFLFPGDYYSDERNDPASFLRAELVFAF